MTRYVALFRGINVGKAKRIAMADLRVLFESLGYTDVRTLLNSGNVIFNGSVAAAALHAEQIQRAVARELGVDAWVIVKSANDVAAVVAGNPLLSECTDPSRLLVAMTTDAKSLAAIEALACADWGGDTIHVGSHAAYLWCANGILESKAAVALLKGLAPTGTTRNWATVEKLHALLQNSA
jgi:uncharacterized protein (DUF1697 family)